MACGPREDGNRAEWRLLGPLPELSRRQCRLVHSSAGRGADVCLFHVDGTFYAMDARCSHAGGPIYEGDIEEADGALKVYCPWHYYDFDLRTGLSDVGLQQQVYEVKVEEDMVYVKHSSKLSLTPFKTS
ncbi:Rieske domain-containing protein [Latimeria chalumnae]|uniref:Si:ch211-212d10.2 n=1 Tax=Latimeria chalumnae TaxID=7897 RepID=H3A0R4_LATCH|nr:PREDICTED: Rieske domain-containing protein-like [Latimeria chalumnae]|eukprot:XP_005999474.1 PREDICTED: Rieske domain-containing protein-like [Latimeria chalumnae]